MHNFFLIIYMSAACTSFPLKGQGLIQNDDFEHFLFCPADFFPYKKQFEKCLNSWFSPTKGTPDYFNRCSRYGAGVPKNKVGNLEPHSGDGYVGIVLMNNPHFLYTEKTFLREYISIKLDKPLSIGVLYEINFYISLADYSKFATDEIGVYFSEKKPDKRTNLNLPYTPQIVFNDMMLENDTSWVELKAVYNATGGEKYLTIGNFETPKGGKLEGKGFTTYPKRQNC